MPKLCVQTCIRFRLFILALYVSFVSIYALVMYLQILTMKQAGEVMVHSYPKMPVLEEMLNTFANQRGAETEESLVALACEGDMQAEWTTFWNYTRHVNPDYTARFEYVPLRELSCAAAGHQSARPMPAAAKPHQQQSSSSSGAKSLDLY